MIDKILVPVDGSELSEEILAQVRRLLVREDAEVVLIHVLPEDLDEDSDEASQALEYLISLRARLAGSGMSAHFHLLHGDPSTEILSFAVAAEPSLIAMSTHGRGGLGRWVRGSVAERVLRHSAHPLLLSSPAGLNDRKEGNHAGFRRILVPLDGSELASDIVPLVRVFATTYESEVILFHCEPLPVGAEPFFPDRTPLALDRHRKFLNGAGIPARVLSVRGTFAGSILDAVDEEKADLVMMTTHGRSGFARWVLGSVAEKVVRHCTVPMVVLRRPRHTGGSSPRAGW